MLMLGPVKEKEFEGNTWTNQVKLNVRCILSQDKKQVVQLKMNVNDKAMAIAEQIADLFAETKYSISFFLNAQKVNLNDLIADLGIGWSPLEKPTALMEEQSTILCLKGGLDAPKIFNRFKQVDSPERQLSYVAEEEAYDAISFIPTKDIKFAGFSVYQVTTCAETEDFKCLYKIKIGTDSWPEQIS